VLAEVDGRVPIIVHVGSTALEDARDLALFCAHNGAAGISSIVPPYYDNVPALVGYFTSLASSVPDLPVLPYFLTQSIKPLDLVKHVLDVPNIVGTKYTGPDMNEFQQIIEVSGGRWTVFAGMDEMCLFALMAGADGNIGSTLNFMPGVYREIQACVSRGDLAQAQVYQMKANRVINVLLQDNLMGALKATVGLNGFDCGRPRLPRQPLTAEQHERLVSRLQETDFEELVRL
jgi:N-acetylneuraminate lyase